MAKKVDTQESPFQPAAANNSNAVSNVITKRPTGRRPDSAGDWAPMFIGALMEGSSVVDASEIAGVSTATPYRRRVDDKEFSRAWQEAANIGTEFLEQEAARRAYHGTIKPVFHKGEICGHVREYSDTLMIFLLKARKPQVYREGIEEGSRGSFVLNVNVVQVTDKPEPEVIDTPVLNLQLADANGTEQDDKGLSEAVTVS